MTWYQILMLVGFPSICVAVITGIARNVIKELKKADRDGKSVRYGVQALLRSQMIDDYNHYTKKGYAPIYAKENFENCWKQYHALGANGVMDEMRKKFLALPEEEK